ncbi:anthranilate phosphoribosyltransferase [Puccinia graminis f. sp. tritici]|uniref:Anthranilate phosphoribosyltransferase n=1 Tax=Puccinia graminis f. sp. tritici TaxID=56615 RepID=A0A5B0RPZ8_PUCGR|nr:anthranilate phosphoribosyltransferase [Puccinia graminis f. sp. tritici]KAA1127449.1 anthranilate phosphoribosyltransferase [Puccinia graminis f. sp. tritici]
MSSDFQPVLRKIVEFCQQYTQPQGHQNQPVNGNAAQNGLKHDHLPILADLQTTIQILADEKTSVPIQFAGLLTALTVSGLDRNERVIKTFVQEILSRWNLGAGLVDRRPPEHDPSVNPICDIVGTGGDGFNTFNVSTTAAIVAAGAGVKVCKHGNRASSSASGSADLLMALGIPLDRLDPSQVAQLIQDPELDFAFLFSAKFYPIFARLSPIRKSLGFPTIFNLLGPLLNPVRPDRLIIGVTKPELGPIFCRVLQLCGSSGSWVVCSEEGLDEISTAGETSLWKLESDGSIIHQRISPTQTFGLPSHSLDLLTGESAQENLQMLHDLLDGNFSTKKHEAILDFVLMNAAALIVLSGKTDDFKEGVKLARDSLVSGKAKATINSFKDKANSIALDGSQA